MSKDKVRTVRCYVVRDHIQCPKCSGEDHHVELWPSVVESVDYYRYTCKGCGETWRSEELYPRTRVVEEEDGLERDESAKVLFENWFAKHTKDWLHDNYPILKNQPEGGVSENLRD